jgi:hypothetical protein
MKSYQGGALIKEKEHNNTKYKVEVSVYTVSDNDDRLCNIVTKVSVKMKVLWFWITIWKEYIFGSEFNNIDDYNDEVEYSVIKADDIIDCLTA